MKAKAFGIVLMLFGLSVSTWADTVIFDSLNGGQASTPASQDKGYGSQMVFSTDVTITAIAVKLDLDMDGELKFVIFDHSTHSLLYASAGENFVDDGDTWKISTPMSFTFLSGHTYDVGAVGDVSAEWDYDIEAGSANGISSVIGNPIFTTFDGPQDGQMGGADGAVELFVPEPSSLALFVLSVGMVWIRRDRSRAS